MVHSPPERTPRTGALGVFLQKSWQNVRTSEEAGITVSDWEKETIGITIVKEMKPDLTAKTLGS